MKCNHKIRSIPSQRTQKITKTLSVLYSSHSWRKSLGGKAHLIYIRSMTLDVVDGEKCTVRGKKRKYTKLRGISELGNFSKSEIQLSERRYINEIRTGNNAIMYNRVLKTLKTV